MVTGGNTEMKLTGCKNYKRILSSVFLMLMINLCLIIFVSGCYLFPEEEKILPPPLKEPPEVTYKWKEVERGDIVNKITGYGYFQFVTKRDISFKYKIARFRAIYVEEGDVVKKGDLLAELDVENIEKKIKSQKIALKKEEIDYAGLIARGADALTLEKAKLDIEAKKIVLESLERDYERGRLTAPIDGEVDYVTDSYKEGDAIKTYKTIIRLADTSVTQLEYDGRNRRMLKQGTVVDVELDDKIYKGKVVPPPENLPEDLAEEAKEKVYIRLTDYEGKVEAGSIAKISLVLESRENVIRIPKHMVRSYGTQKYVYILEEGLRKECNIKTGLETNDYIEVIEGLEEGDKLFIQ